MTSLLYGTEREKSMDENKRKKPRMEDFQAIIQMIERGSNYKEASLATGFGAEYVQRLLRNYKSWWEQDWSKLVREAETGHFRRDFCEFCEQKTGIATPKEIKQAIRARLDNDPRKKAPDAPEVEEPKPKDAPTDNTGLYLCKMLEALAKQNELLEQLMDVVIQKHVSDIKDNINGNSDIMHGEVVKIAQTLDAIKCNTRKRGM